MFDNDDEEMSYIITDIDKFVNETRKIVFGGFGHDDINDEENLEYDDFMSKLTEADYEELDKTLSQQECMAIVHSYVKPRKTKSGKIRYIITDQMFTNIIEDFNSRLVSNLLNELVKKGLIESSYDAEENDFIFWVPDHNKKPD